VRIRAGMPIIRADSHKTLTWLKPGECARGLAGNLIAWVRGLFGVAVADTVVPGPAGSLRPRGRDRRRPPGGPRSVRADRGGSGRGARGVRRTPDARRLTPSPSVYKDRRGRRGVSRPRALPTPNLFLMDRRGRRGASRPRAFPRRILWIGGGMVRDLSTPYWPPPNL
jgi:hypothetical protein